jgi:predicted TIM-barrel fold metal-dependent hydrolase
MLITDAQTHLYHPNTPEHPWPGDSWRPTPEVKGFTGEQMIAAMDGAGVDRAVIVPPVWISDDQQIAFDTADTWPDRFKIMGRLDPYAPDAKEAILTWLDKPHMLGIRLAFIKWHLGGALLKEVTADPSIDWFWAECERLGIPLMCLTQEAAAQLAPIARRHPKLPLIVDHLASVAGDTVEEAFVALDDLVNLAQFPNVYVKVSDAPNRSKEAFPFRDVHPVIRWVYNAFGPRRMLWAVDITQIGQLRYADCLRLWQEGVPFLSNEDRNWILGDTAAAVLNWPEA